jgi:hypothetical protein
MTAQDVVRRLPDIPVVRDRSRSLAMLDAILSPVWEYRYYSCCGVRQAAAATSVQRMARS